MGERPRKGGRRKRVEEEEEEQVFLEVEVLKRRLGVECCCSFECAFLKPFASSLPAFFFLRFVSRCSEEMSQSRSPGWENSFEERIEGKTRISSAAAAATAASIAVADDGIHSLVFHLFSLLFTLSV